MKTRKILLLFLFCVACFAQSATRPVIISWVPTTTAGVTGYNVYRIVGAVAPGQVPTNPTLLTATSLPPTATQYIDSTATIGSTFTYALVAVISSLPPCTSTTPVTSVCGTSAYAFSPVTPIPLSPAAFTTTITVQVP